MKMPINFDLLREITDGDDELEGELFITFMESAEECLQGMQQGLDAGDNEQWRAAAHALKGSSINLGAELLSALCRQAQDTCNGPQNEKRDLLMIISSEYRSVSACLQAEMSR